MTNLIDESGFLWNRRIRRGSQSTHVLSSFTDRDGVAITDITSARIGFRNVLIGELGGSAITGLTVTCTVTSGSTVSWTMTETQTRLFNAGDDYCYVVEVTYSDGTIQPIVKGNLIVDEEVAT